MDARAKDDQGYPLDKRGERIELAYLKIEWAIHQLGTSQALVEAATGLPETKLARCLAGNSHLRPSEVARVGQFLNRPIDYLMRDDIPIDEPPRPDRLVPVEPALKKFADSLPLIYGAVNDLHERMARLARLAEVFGLAAIPEGGREPGPGASGRATVDDLGPADPSAVAARAAEEAAGPAPGRLPRKAAPKNGGKPRAAR